MWSEFTTPANLDIRLWPRAAVVAERLWSPAEKSRDMDDLFRRLAVFSSVSLDVQPQPGPLEEILEPGKYVYRHLSKKYTEDSPMDQLVDRLPPESLRAREFRRIVERREYASARNLLEGWKRTNAPGFPEELYQDAVTATKIGLQALDAIEGIRPQTTEWKAAQLKTLQALGDNHREIRIAIVPALLLLLREIE